MAKRSFGEAFPKTHHLFVGNPGVGKSTLLNGMLGELVFKSGFNPGKGLTTALQREERNGHVYMDTPGLADIEMRKQAAAAISAALKQDGLYKVIFVVTLEAGRVRPQDKATMQLVLQAAKEIGQQYAVIFNKVSKAAAKRLKQNPNEQKQVLAGLFEGMQPTVNIHFCPADEELNDEDNVLKPLPHDVSKFIANMPPIHITAAKVEDVKGDQFENLVGKLEQQLTSLKEDNDRLRKEMGRQEKLFENQLKMQAEMAKAAQHPPPQPIIVKGGGGCPLM